MSAGQSFAAISFLMPSRSTAASASRHKTLPVEGVQFHPESILSEHGHALLENFLKQAREAAAHTA